MYKCTCIAILITISPTEQKLLLNEAEQNCRYVTSVQIKPSSKLATITLQFSFLGNKANDQFQFNY